MARRKERKNTYQLVFPIFFATLSLLYVVQNIFHYLTFLMSGSNIEENFYFYKSGQASKSFNNRLKSLGKHVPTLLTKCEKRMRHMCSTLRSKLNWMEQMNCPKALEQWKGEAGTSEIKHVFDELKCHKIMHVPGSHTHISAVDMVWYSDTRDQVLSLVDPSLYVLDYERSSILPEPIKSPVDSLKYCALGHFPLTLAGWKQTIDSMPRVSSTAPAYTVPSPEIWSASKKFSWLPSEFYVDTDGTTSIKSYINNLHPVKHAEMYPIIAKAFSRFVPIFEQVITDAVYPQPYHIENNRGMWYSTSTKFPCDHGAKDYKEKYEKWKAAVNFKDATPCTPVVFHRPIPPQSLRNRQLQVVVKMSNIMLTPELPEYNGDNWHVEAMSNERIIATGVFYYDVHNTTKGTISFRERDPSSDTETLTQELGQINIKDGLCFAFPNSYQHKLSGFKLDNPSKPGHHKMLQFYLIDPSTRILSTEIVPPQQKSWWAEQVLSTKPICLLPLVVADIILDNIDYPFSAKDAKSTRDETTKERRKINERMNMAYFVPTFVFDEDDYRS
ncbi:hypothetical protein BX661DRAFT_182411 [Kickxella alabastrina]|uniref:uncharacterized protein n=1 Tax=Kickxella alabastrina TaxID=61397 RepID=UPI00221F07FF|nr:uncharacterized protein BX661DRAFT_182411 [Kickxella alabastrina]KAI7827769.1 hypothetical protein BX661DRAFT_182411 [Kickxella alabastrina]